MLLAGVDESEKINLLRSRKLHYRCQALGGCRCSWKSCGLQYRRKLRFCQINDKLHWRSDVLRFIRGESDTRHTPHGSIFKLVHLGLEILVGSITAPDALDNAHTIDIAVFGQKNIFCFLPLPLLGLPRVRVLNHSGLNHSKNPYAYAASLCCQFQ